MKNAVRWLMVYIMLHGGLTMYGFWVDHLQDIERCKARNEATENGAVITLETLIEVSGGEAPPERIEEVRRVLHRNLAKARVDC